MDSFKDNKITVDGIHKISLFAHILKDISDGLKTIGGSLELVEE